MRTPELQRLMLQPAWEFTLGHLRKFHIRKGLCSHQYKESLQELKEKCSDAREGYVFAFLQTPYRHYLYLDITGAQHVLGVHPEDSKWEDGLTQTFAVELTSTEAALSVLTTPFGNHLKLWGYSFEHFLVTLYFSSWGSDILEQDVFAKEDDISNPQSRQAGDSAAQTVHCRACRNSRSEGTARHLAAHGANQIDAECDSSEEDDSGDEWNDSDDPDEITQADEEKTRADALKEQTLPIQLHKLLEPLKIFLGTLYGEHGQATWRQRPLMWDVCASLLSMPMRPYIRYLT